MTPGDFLGTFLRAWLIAVAAAIVYRMLTGRISLKGLFTIDGTRFSPERLQMLVVTLGVLASYVQGSLTAHKMQPIPSELFSVFAASHVLYLGGKIARGTGPQA
jgi:hypothetical protein